MVIINEVSLYNFNDNVKVVYTNKKANLTCDYRQKVEEHWMSLLKSGKAFFRGDIFTITEIKNYGDYIEIYVELTDYAHFLYSIHNNEKNNQDCRVIYTSALIETIDNKYVFGEMGSQTAAPKKYQLIGGGIDKGDLKENLLSLEHSIRKEITEETGIDTYDKETVKEINDLYLKCGGKSNFLSAIFKLHLNITESELKNKFDDFNKELELYGGFKELSSLTFIDANQYAVSDFIKNNNRETDENLIPTLKAQVGLYKVKNMTNFK